MQRQALEMQTLYAELVEQLVAAEAARTIGYAAGSFTTKTIKGRSYGYFQYSEPGGGKKQIYVGPADDAYDALVRRYLRDRELAAGDLEGIERLSAAARAGGALVMDHASARVIRGLADAGVFQLGGMLVGTQAFIALGNVLGVRWASTGVRTQDIDVAIDLEIGLPTSLASADVPSALESLEMGFLPVPSLDRGAASTSFKVRGQALRIDLLMPAARAGGAASAQVPRLGTSAKRLKYLDLLTDAPIRAAVIDGTATLVNVPDPSRFAVHKLIVAGERPVAEQTKRSKDLVQAAQLIEVLADDRPRELQESWQAASQRGRSWVRALKRGSSLLAAREPELAERLTQVVAQ